MEIRKILSIPSIYVLFQYIVGAEKLWTTFSKEYIKPEDGNKILDIGCGPGTILNYLPEVDYTGFDMSPEYIEAAKRDFGNRGTFLCKKVTLDAIESLSQFDIVLAIGIIHHLTDEETLDLFELAKKAMKPSGKLVTIDGCFTEKQSPIARFILKKDRGQFVRKKEEYLTLAGKVFSNVSHTVRHDMSRIPFTHMIMECRQ